MKRSARLTAIATMILLLSACAGRAGVLRGKLVDQNGSQLSGEYIVLLCKVNTGNDTCKLNTRYKTATVAGEFELRDAPVGQYGIYIISVATGYGTLLVRDEGNPLVIQLEKDADFDLGTVRLVPQTPQ